MNSIKIAPAPTVPVVSPAFAHSNGHALFHSTRPGAVVSGEVILGGRYIGQDPDANIRAEQRRDSSLYFGDD